MNTHTVNVNTLRSLTNICRDKVKHFCTISARLYGKQALYEQLRNHNLDGLSFEDIETDLVELKQEVKCLCSECISALYRLNHIAEKHGLLAPLAGVDEMDHSEVVEALDTYVANLVSNSNYQEWSEFQD